MRAGSGVLEARPVVGVSAMMLNTLLIPLMGVAIKKLTEMDVSTVEMLAYRSLLVVAVLTPFLISPANRRAIRKADRRAHLVHAVFGISSMACFYYALRTLPLATVTSINFTTPIFALFFAWLLYGDRPGWRSMAATVLGFAGTLIVLRPGADGLSPDMLVVVLGSILAAAMNLSVRRMPPQSSNFAVIYYFGAAGAVVFAALYALDARLLSLDTAPWILLLGAIAVGIHVFVALAYRFASSMMVGALDYFRLFWALILGLWLFGEWPYGRDAAGMALIVGSGLYILYRETRSLRPAVAR